VDGFVLICPGGRRGAAGKERLSTKRHIESEKTIMARVERNRQAPGFTALDFNGNSVSLSDLTGRMNVLLVFNRSFS
jgi:hypothetical protein